VCLLGFLDLVLCAIICKVCIFRSANTRLLIDKHTGKVYYINDSLKLGKRINSTENNFEEEYDHDEPLVRLPSQYLDSLTDLGWEGMIITQLISSQDRKPTQIKGLAGSQENLQPETEEVTLESLGNEIQVV
jgi:hypothetical protein